MNIQVQEFVPAAAHATGTVTVGPVIPAIVTGPALAQVTRADGTTQNLYPIAHSQDRSPIVVTANREGGGTFRGTLGAFLAAPGVTLQVNAPINVQAGFTSTDSKSGKMKAGALVAVAA